MSIRVLHIYSHYHPDTFGGGEQLINQIAKGTARIGVTPTVMTLTHESGPAQLMVDGHVVHRCKIDLSIASNRFSWGALAKLRTLAAQADLLHFYYPWPYGDLLELLSGNGKPYVVSQLSDIVKQRLALRALYAPLEWMFMRRASAIVATSPNYAATSPLLARWPQKVRVIPIGLDPAGYPASEPARLEQWRARIGGPFLLFVGVMRYYKGLQFLLEALRGTDIRVALVGAGPQEPELRAQAQALGLDRVFFLGRLSEADKRALFELSRAFVFPSHLRAESFGISLLEAALYGKPMVSCEIGTGTSFVNAHRQTGLVVPPADVEALREAMLLLWRDERLCAQWGAAARQRFEDVFAADTMAHSYLKLYQAILSKQ